jgi:phosphate starvation-inducible PhoH-like protein
MDTNTAIFDYADMPPIGMGRKQTKSERRRARKEENMSRRLQGHITPDLIRVEPKTANQQRTFDAFNTGENLLLHGSAGTGKTFLALYLALNSVLNGNFPKPIVILRSVVPSRDMGFLPGGVEQKAEVYEEPYRSICHELTNKASAYDFFKSQGIIQFSTTSFLRGLTFRNNIVIVDEIQNLKFSEINTVMTRIGDGCRILAAGDFTQTDLQRNQEKQGLLDFIKIVRTMPSFSMVEFSTSDIVRSRTVKEYIMAKERLGISA